MSKLREFGSDSTFRQILLADCNGFLTELISIEEDRSISYRGPLADRLRIVETARQLLEIAENSDRKIMGDVLKKIRNAGL